MTTVGLVVAGGKGMRMGSELPKQYMPVAGKPLLVHALLGFLKAGIEDLILVVPQSDIEFVREDVLGKHSIDAVRAIIPGGHERQDSVSRGLKALKTDTDIVAIHDAVRPFVSPALIREVISQAVLYSAATLGVPLKDTIKKVDKHNIIIDSLNRNELWMTQTPQVFKREVIIEAYRRAYEENFYATDDAALVERIGVPVKMVMGSYANIKITTPEDLKLAELLVNKGIE